jgi:hypothetical protein
MTVTLDRSHYKADALVPNNMCALKSRDGQDQQCLIYALIGKSLKRAGTRKQFNQYVGSLQLLLMPSTIFLSSIKGPPFAIHLCSQQPSFFHMKTINIYSIIFFFVFIINKLSSSNRPCIHT